MNHTSNYQLSQWERSDKVLMEDFNADNAKIDAALGALAEKTAQKAAQSALDVLSQTVAGHASLLARKGNCRIETLSYAGTGKTGKGIFASIPFSTKPVVFFVIGPRCLLVAECASGYNTYIGYINSDYGSSFNGGGVNITWSGNTAQLEVTGGVADLNVNNYSYKVIALFAADA